MWGYVAFFPSYLTKKRQFTEHLQVLDCFGQTKQDIWRWHLILTNNYKCFIKIKDWKMNRWWKYFTLQLQSQQYLASCYLTYKYDSIEFHAVRTTDSKFWKKRYVGYYCLLLLDSYSVLDTLSQGISESVLWEKKWDWCVISAVSCFSLKCLKMEPLLGLFLLFI